MGKLNGKVAIITGSTAGIGRAMAERFAAEGAALVICGRNRDHGEAAARALRDSGASALYQPLDITDEDQVRALVERAVGEFGGLDILVNNAGANGEAIAVGALHELPSALFDTSVRTGIQGLFWCCKYSLPPLIARGGGTVINISSLAAIRAIPKMGAYAMAKAAMEALTRQIANDYAAHNIRCNSLLVGTVRPGAGDTSTLPDNLDFDALNTQMRATTMLGHLGNYGDVAEAALFLASDSARYLTGVSLPVDGGAASKIQYPDFTRHGH
ncbi:MAG: SDR family NAD(P)-dependent oxidoreductase [Pseudomonadota bacterium]|nr:SDR family NAD(P)-dependent oxidoreductase [Pseudomonadota bacterium]